MRAQAIEPGPLPRACKTFQALKLVVRSALPRGDSAGRSLQGKADAMTEIMNKAEPNSFDRYALYEWLPEGFPQWMEGTSDAEYAKTRIKQLWLESSESEYFVQDFIANTIVSSTTDYRSGRCAA